MTIVDADAYRKGFVLYLRKGVPIRLGRKEVHSTERYVWRTRGDGKVRLEHRRNEGRIFRWDDPPDTGHPGEDYNCRCEAEPYYEGSTEFADHEFASGLASSYDRWTDRDFVRHYYFGAGRPVTLLEIGHLREIVEYYAYGVGGEGVLVRLSGQIASAARKKKGRECSHTTLGFSMTLAMLNSLMAKQLLRESSLGLPRSTGK